MSDDLAGWRNDKLCDSQRKRFKHTSDGAPRHRILCPGHRTQNPEYGSCILPVSEQELSPLLKEELLTLLRQTELSS